jgi:xylulokinase
MNSRRSQAVERGSGEAPLREPWILAVDLGNGGPKVAVVSLDGEVLRVAFRPVRTRIGLDGAATQDAVEWWTGLRAAAREAIADAGADGAQLHVVAITGQYGSSVPVGADGEPVGDVLLWADTRARDLAREVIGGPVSIGGFAPHKALPFVRITGGAPAPSGNDPTGHVLLLRERLRDVYEKTRVILEPVDYLGLRFTGRAAATPASMLASWITDNRIGAPFGYVDSLLVRTRRERSKLPELVPTGSVLGPLLPEVAEDLGVAGGVPVVCGVPDLHAAVVGSGAIAPYDTHIAISTTAWISARVPFKRTDIQHQIATVPGVDPAHPIVVNNQETGGAALHWLREQIVAPDDGLLGGGSGIGAEGVAAEGLAPSFDDLIRLAGQAPAGCEGLLFMPWLNGERSPAEDKIVRAGWLNLSLRTDRAMLVRSVLEGIAYNARWLFDAYEKFLRRPVPKVRLLGGGAQSDLWCQIYADVLGRPVEQVADPRNAQLRGVALWARVCLGELTLDDVPALVPVPERFVPTSAAGVYARNYAEYRKLFGSLKGMYHRLNRGR